MKLAVLMQLCGWAAESLPVRGAWIEIVRISLPSTRSDVAPRAGSVD